MNRNLKNTQPGQPDPDFATGGKLTFPTRELSGNDCNGLMALPDNKFLVANYQEGGESIYVARMTSQGQIDDGSGYGDGNRGVAKISLPGEYVSVNGLGSLRDGGCLISAQTLTRGQILIRLSSSGALVEGFGKGGVLAIADLGIATVGQKWEPKKDSASRHDLLPNEASNRTSPATRLSFAEQPDGKIVFASTVESQESSAGAVVRITPLGGLDITFNKVGYAIAELGSGLDSIGGGVASQRDGRLVLFGAFYSEAGRGAFAVRFHADGTSDEQFQTLKLLGPTIAGMSIRARDDLIALVGDRPQGFEEGQGVIIVLNHNGVPNRVFNEGQPLYTKLQPMGEKWHRCAFSGVGDNTLTVAGTTASSFLTDKTHSLIARFELTSALDRKFNGKGWYGFDEPPHLEVTGDMAILRDGDILVSGALHAGRDQLLPYASFVIKLKG
ncbi:hypothetical protein [Pseudomonas sp. 58(2021)]|uniref:hypothetical protein n=1 Tax=Pseudomonas sp. 58(2021) TaxID=2813330 RepID=UPI001A9D08BF|nr:hypothetical protein [Pseudomonas sp. 58(2021)]